MKRVGNLLSNQKTIVLMQIFVVPQESADSTKHKELKCPQAALTFILKPRVFWTLLFSYFLRTRNLKLDKTTYSININLTENKSLWYLKTGLILFGVSNDFRRFGLKFRKVDNFWIEILDRSATAGNMIYAET